MKQKVIIIAIDGPAGAGKSTIAKRLAKELNIFYLDTGAMYRAITLKAMQRNINMQNEQELIALTRNSRVEINPTLDGQKITLDGKDVTDEIRSQSVTNNTKYIAKCSGVRTIVVEWQRKMAEGKSIVMEGRDIGTVVFPKADFKFYLDADIHERARRRLKELQDKGEQIDEIRLTKDITQRDQKDMQRDAGPLRKADDAILIDSTRLNIDDVIKKMLEVIHHG